MESGAFQNEMDGQGKRPEQVDPTVVATLGPQGAEVADFLGLMDPRVEAVAPQAGAPVIAEQVELAASIK